MNQSRQTYMSEFKREAVELVASLACQAHLAGNQLESQYELHRQLL